LAFVSGHNFGTEFADAVFEAHAECYFVIGVQLRRKYCESCSTIVPFCRTKVSAYSWARAVLPRRFSVVDFWPSRRECTWNV
jgi:hypothetical protein